jgi:hypothetical protein
VEDGISRDRKSYCAACVRWQGFPFGPCSVWQRGEYVRNSKVECEVIEVINRSACAGAACIFFFRSSRASLNCNPACASCSRKRDITFFWCSHSLSLTGIPSKLGILHSFDVFV